MYFCVVPRLRSGAYRQHWNPRKPWRARSRPPREQPGESTVGGQASVHAQSAPGQSELPPPGEQPDEAASTDTGQPDQPQTVASEESPPPCELPGKSTVGSAGKQTVPAPASVGAAPAPVQSVPEDQPKPPPDKQSDEPTDPAALTDLIFRELTAMPHAHFKNGYLLQDLIEYLFVAAQLAKDAAGLPRVELLKSIFKGIVRAARAGHYTLKGHPDDPSGQARPIQPATLSSFLFDEWERSRLIVDGPGTIWHGVTVWRSEVEAPDTESDLGEPSAPAPVAEASVSVANTETPAAEPEVVSPPAVDAITVETPAASAASLINRGGRPTDRDLVLEEAERRLEHPQQVPKTLRAFSRELRKWLSGHGRHRVKKTGEVMKAKTIEDRVRPLWNAYEHDRDMVLEEAERRLRRQEVPETLVALSRELHEWLEVRAEYRAAKTGEVMKAKTIEDHVQSLWKAHKHP